MISQKDVCIEDNTPRVHKIVRFVFFISSFTWAVNPVQDYMGETTPLEKIFTRMIPLLIVAAYCMRMHRERLRRLFLPGLIPLLWYVLVGVIGGFTGIQPMLALWKGAEIIIALMWIVSTCYDEKSTQREFVAFLRWAEILLGVTVVLAFISPARGFQHSASIIPWMKGYYPIINPNALGFMSVYVMTRLLFLPANHKIPRMMLVSFTLLCAQSRTSYAVTGVVLLVFVFDGIRSRQFFRVFLAMVFGLFAMCLAIGWMETLVKIFLRGQDAEAFSSLSGRTNYWDFTLSQVRWLGGGLATGARSLIFVSDEVFYKGIVGTHNAFVEALIDAGYVGAIPFIAGMFVFHLKQAFNAFARPSTMNMLFLCFIVICFARCMTSMAMALYSFDFNILMYYFAWQLLKNSPAPQPKPRPRPVVYEKTLHELEMEKAAGE